MKTLLLALTVAVLTRFSFADDTHPMLSSEKAARNIILPSLDFRNANMDDVIRFLSETAKRQAPDGVEINLSLMDSPSVKANNISINLRKIPLYDALNLIAEQANYIVEYQEKAGVLSPCKTGERAGNLSSEADRSAGKRKSKAIPASKEAAQKIHIPSLDFRDADIEDVVSFLSITARRLGPDGIGVNIVYTGPQHVKEHRITMSIRKMNLAEALDPIADKGKLSIEYQEHVIVLRPRQ